MGWALSGSRHTTAASSAADVVPLPRWFIFQMKICWNVGVTIVPMECLK